MKNQSKKIYLFILLILTFEYSNTGSKEVRESIAHIDADTILNSYEKAKSVNSNLLFKNKKALYVNKIIITGNRITKDSVIRRRIELNKGDLITKQKLDRSQRNIEHLSCFEVDGVCWRIHKISEELANLELNVREIKIGEMLAGLGYGRNHESLSPCLRGMVFVRMRNLFGRGGDGAFLVESDRYHLNKLKAKFMDPNIIDSDISFAVNVYKEWEEYEPFILLNKAPWEEVIGGSIRFGLPLPRVYKDLQFLFEIGYEYVENNGPCVIGVNKRLLEPILRRKFQEGTLNWFGLDLIKDTRNHPIYPSSGYKISLLTKTALPSINREYSFLKSELKACCYIPLIGKDSLVLSLKGMVGAVNAIGGLSKETGRKKVIPYRELFRMGGQSTVRGFAFGSIGTAWITGDPLGGRYSTLFNSELIFPLPKKPSIKGYVFYDAGSAWGTPKDCAKNMSLIKNNNFNLRHSVGLGLKISKPFSTKIDLAYKLNRDKFLNKSPYHLSLSMNYTW